MDHLDKPTTYYTMLEWKDNHDRYIGTKEEKVGEGNPSSCTLTVQLNEFVQLDIMKGKKVTGTNMEPNS